MKNQTHEMLSRVESMGISTSDALALRRISMTLRRISMTLHRWYELECGDGNDYASWCLERNEDTGIPYMVTYPHSGKTRRVRVADRENGALRRMAAILRRYPDLAAYVQTDPRGAALYVYRQSDLHGNIDSYYSSIGVAIYK